ncbi:hypothetical protein VTK73DRAFT_5679 [Phialemonium thermophilum]|uniref:Uncharacterized protein n=1 Tax=Phialemonium thermophilum TaxID=223376 RepID=A0ABR3V0V2_9PEZI
MRGGGGELGNRIALPSAVDLSLFWSHAISVIDLMTSIIPIVAQFEYLHSCAQAGFIYLQMASIELHVSAPSRCLPRDAYFIARQLRTPVEMLSPELL